MKILVPIKRVVHREAKVCLLPGTPWEATDLPHEINPYDEVALEEAIRIKERTPETQIVVASIDEPGHEDILRKALAMGADEAILMEAQGFIDSYWVASELAKLAPGFDLILMGRQSSDRDNGIVGPMLAGKLGWPHATSVEQIELDKRVKVVRSTDSGTEALAIPFPCLVTVTLRINDPRSITIMGITQARSKPLERRLATGMSRTQIVKTDAAADRGPCVMVTSVSELITALKERGAL
jgi:electron transfer flavoprotein beta subunit